MSQNQNDPYTFTFNPSIIAGSSATAYPIYMPVEASISPAKPQEMDNKQWLRDQVNEICMLARVL